MSDIAEKLALLICEQCKRMDNESDLDYSTRLYSVYSTCHDNISDLEKQKDNKQCNESYDSYLESSL